ncbi:hypothetical protein T439DRAFT_325165 [Meredithblackwellia eburnea MCA 4105]
MVAAPYVIPPFEYADLLDKGPFGDWRDQLAQDGYAVIPGVLSPERSAEYRSRAMDWLESWDRGFKRDDPSTWGQEHLPMYHRGGMYGTHGIHHEQWVWDIRTEPAVRAVFEKLWGTHKLVSSFDTAALMLPGPPKPPSPTDAWPHIDLSPSRKGFFLAQGIMNLNESGPEDGGLAVMKGSSKLMKQFFDEHGRPPIPPEGEKLDTFKFKEEDKQWFFDRGCEWIKVCAKAGDFIVWDSATMHQGNPPLPQSKNKRVITYVCMGPEHLMNERDRAVRKQAFTELRGTSHPPFQGIYIVDNKLPRPETGKFDHDWNVSKNPVKVTDEVRRLAGILPYDN